MPTLAAPIERHHVCNTQSTPLFYTCVKEQEETEEEDQLEEESSTAVSKR